MPLPAAHFQSVPAAVKMVIASDLSLRGAKRRGALSAKREEVPLGCNLAVPGRITGHSRRKRNCLHEIATSAVGLLAMTNSGALRHKINAANAASLHKP